MYTALCFFTNYISNYPNLYPWLPNITVYCDSQGVLDHIQKVTSLHTISACSTNADDYNIYIAIWSTLWELMPLKIWFGHVKGHQDCNCKHHLSLPEMLNIKCDKRATEYLPLVRQIKPQPNPMIIQCYPHLIINSQTIVQEVQESLWDAASPQDYWVYMQCKHHWSSCNCDNVNWYSMKLALRQFACNNCQE